MLSELIEEIEERLRLIIREEIKLALLDPKSSLHNSNHYPEQKSNDSQVSKNTPILLTAADVAKILGVSVQRVYELARSRKTNGFPVIVLGERQYRFSKEAMLEWINSVNK